MRYPGYKFYVEDSLRAGGHPLFSLLKFFWKYKDGVHLGGGAIHVGPILE